ncbi:MAG TPA: hypothetical protein VGI24_10120 [Solirubrobacteraceae bacterium]
MDGRDLTDGSSGHRAEGNAAGTDARTTVFGLDVRSEIPLSFLGRTSAKPTGRPLAISAHDTDATTPPWPRDAELVCDERLPDGGVSFRVESHPQAGYLISGPLYGSHLLSPDGRTLNCDPEGRHEHAWQRLLIAQVLPFAALLQGLEVFHAGAIVKSPSEGAVALLGPSGMGKTSVGLELCRRGASFLADDVLALECRGEELVAHPGAPLAGVDHTEAERVRSTRESPARILAVNSREQLVRMGAIAEPAPLKALFFLDRRTDGPERPRFDPVLDSKLLLAATFNFVLSTPARLRGLLEVCALAARVRVERIVCGLTTSVPQLAAAVELRLGPSP